MVTLPKPVMPLRRRTALALVIAGLTLLPAIVMVVVAWIGTGQLQAAATWASLPAIAGIVAAATVGRRFAIQASVVMAFAAPLAIVAGLSPVSGAALMALLSLIVGRLSRLGLHKSSLLVPVMLAWPLIDPPAWNGQAADRLNNSYLLWMAVIFLVGGLIPSFIVPFLLRKRPKKPLIRHPKSEALPYTVIITVLVTISTYFVLDDPRMYGGAFLIAAILVLAPIGETQTLKPTLWRIIGTIIGSVFVLAIVASIDSLTWVYLVGVVLITIALMARFGRFPWLYYVFMMPATACLNATSLTQVSELGEQRVVDNIIGGALVLVASACAIAYSHWAKRHGHSDDGDGEADELVDDLPTVAATS